MINDASDSASKSSLLPSFDWTVKDVDSDAIDALQVCITYVGLWTSSFFHFSSLLGLVLNEFVCFLLILQWQVSCLLSISLTLLSITHCFLTDSWSVNCHYITGSKKDLQCSFHLQF